MKQWCVYILRCKDDTLYTGSTDDFPKRLEAHRQGKGANYTRGRSPLEPVYLEQCPHKSSALKREYAIKQLSRQEKLALIQTRSSFPTNSSQEGSANLPNPASALPLEENLV
ncbi:MAG: GIY-YIG nuclease family protein [Oscillospiraceae bacterium]|nr:GIY-YIG nuclease family protein [Oscillospiraceae bacterium]